VSIENQIFFRLTPALDTVSESRRMIFFVLTATTVSFRAARDRARVE